MALSVLLAMALCASQLSVSVRAASLIDYGDCGAEGYDLSWVLHSDGELVISGTGKMAQWGDFNGTPWYKYRSLVKSVTILDRVTWIGRCAFNYCDNLSSVTIPNSVTGIGGRAFTGCISLKSLTIPNSVTSIGEFAFSGCTGLTSMTIPDSVTLLAGCVFDGCSGLKSVTIPGSVKTIWVGTFNDCTSLTDVTIMDGVTEILRGAFGGCTSLENFTIPDCVTTIGHSAFGRCAGLKNVTIPDSVTSIGDYAFYGCLRLKQLTIPNSVTEIGSQAFYDTAGLTDIYFGGSEAEWLAAVGTNDICLDDSVIVHYSDGGEYRIGALTIRDNGGTVLPSIPQGSFLVTVPITKTMGGGNGLIILATYTASGQYHGMVYVEAEDIPVGVTIRITLPVDNADGTIMQLKAFPVASFSNLMPLGATSVFS